MVRNGMIPMVTATAITHMEHKVTGSLMTLIVGKILTVMVTLTKMMHSSMMQHNGMILMATGMGIISMVLMVMYSLMILMNGRIQMKTE